MRFSRLRERRQPEDALRVLSTVNVLMSDCAQHLLWIPFTALVGFAAAFVFADLLVLPVDLYKLPADNVNE